MFIDEAIISVRSGSGGDGCISFRREKFLPKGGPDGGDGGKGGDVYFRVIRDVKALAQYKQKEEREAQSGESGQKRSMHGKSAEDLYLTVPSGSISYNREYDIRYECNTEGEEILVLRGGKGGLGNEKFKSATNRTPEEFTKGDNLDLHYV